MRQTTLRKLQKEYPQLDIWCERLPPNPDSETTYWFYWVRIRPDGDIHECVDKNDLIEMCEYLAKPISTKYPTQKEMR